MIKDFEIINTDIRDIHDNFNDKEDVIGLFYIKTDSVCEDLLKLISYLKLSDTIPLHDITHKRKEYQLTVSTVPCIIMKKNCTVYRMYGDEAFIYIMRYYYNNINDNRSNYYWITTTAGRLFKLYSKLKCKKCILDHLSLNTTYHDCKIDKLLNI